MSRDPNNAYRMSENVDGTLGRRFAVCLYVQKDRHQTRVTETLNDLGQKGRYFSPGRPLLQFPDPGSLENPRRSVVVVEKNLDSRNLKSISTPVERGS